MQNRTLYEAVMNYTPDISEYISYSWFQWYWYFDEISMLKRLCRWLGPTHNIGQAFYSYILLDNATYITRSSVIGIATEELQSERMKEET